MSAEKFLVTGATGETGRYTVQRLLEKGHAVRALVHKQDERSEALRGTGAEVVVGDLLEHDDAVRMTVGTSAAYFCYPVRPGLIQATVYFADAAKRAGLEAVVSLSQISAREDSKSHAARDHWITERVFDWSGVPVVYLRPTFFAQWLLYRRSRATIVEDGVIDLPYGEGRHAPIAAEDQARLIAAILAQPPIWARPTLFMARLSWIRPGSPRPLVKCSARRALQPDALPLNAAFLREQMPRPTAFGKRSRRRGKALCRRPQSGWRRSAGHYTGQVRRMDPAAVSAAALIAAFVILPVSTTAAKYRI
jgi:uncharacterized protein YbjT (DUF2867 family)